MHSWNVPAGIPGGWTGSLRSSDRKCVLREGGERERRGRCFLLVLPTCFDALLILGPLHTHHAHVPVCKCCWSHPPVLIADCY